jgi:quinol monooxygenase YgiN
MLQHIVMWTLKDAADAPRFKQLLDSCAHLVPGMEAFEVGIRTEGLEATTDVVLVSRFRDAAALEAYQSHSHHQAVAAQLGGLRASRHVLDHWISPAPATSGPAA